MESNLRNIMRKTHLKSPVILMFGLERETPMTGVSVDY